MKKTYLVANWKSNKTPMEASSWVDQVKPKLSQLSPNLETVLCVPLIHMELIRQKLPLSKIGAQNISTYPDGAYTGEISARMLSSLVTYAILGHSERRLHLHESSSQVALKVTQALDNNIIPIVAVSGQNWLEQFNHFQPHELSRCLIMYEPPEAISRQTGPVGEGDAAPVEEVLPIIAQIKRSAPNSPVLYGGSVKSHNIAKYLEAKIIDGVVPGSASLNAEEWLRLMAISQEIRG